MMKILLKSIYRCDRIFYTKYREKAHILRIYTPKSEFYLHIEYFLLYFGEITVKNTLFERRSIRAYKVDQIKDHELEYVLKAALYTPTGRNFQSTIMVSVQDKELICRLSKMNADIMGTDNDPFYGAPTVVIVFADTSIPTHFEDGCLAMGNMLNAAYETGLGSCWIHRARQMFETDEGKALMKEWGIPENYVGIGNCILGYADCETPAPAPRKDGRIIKL